MILITTFISFVILWPVCLDLEVWSLLDRRRYALIDQLFILILIVYIGQLNLKKTDFIITNTKFVTLTLTRLSTEDDQVQLLLSLSSSDN